MKRRTRLATSLLSVATVAGMLAAGVPADAENFEVTDVTSTSGVLDIDLEFNSGTVDIGPTPYALLNSPTQGSTITEAGYNFNDEITGGLMTAVTDASLDEDGYAAANATAEDIDITLGGADILAADSLRAECRHDGNKGAGVTTITDGVAEQATALDETPEPNTVIEMQGIGTLTLNQQVSSGDGTIEVTAAVIEVDMQSVQDPVEGEIIINRVTCDADGSETVTPAPSPTPTEASTVTNGPVRGTPTATG